MPVILKVLEGPDAGHIVHLNNGETVVGTGSRASLRLTTPTASVEHFVVTQTDDIFTIENLSARGTLLNDAKIAGKVRIRLRDKIRVSEDTVIRIETEGGDSIITQYRSLVIALLVVLIVVGIGVVLFNPFGEEPKPRNWERTQIALTKYVDTTRKFPADLKRSWAAAWKKDTSGKSVNDFKEASKEWLAVQIALQKFVDTEKLNPEVNEKKLDKLLRNTKSSDWVETNPDEEVSQILYEFVAQRYNRAMQKSEQRQGLLE